MDIIASKRQELSDLLKEINMSDTYSEKIIAAFDELADNNPASFEIPYIKEAIYSDASNQTRTIMLFLLLSLTEYEKVHGVRFRETFSLIRYRTSLHL